MAGSLPATAVSLMATAAKKAVVGIEVEVEDKIEGEVEDEIAVAIVLIESIGNQVGWHWREEDLQHSA